MFRSNNLCKRRTVSVPLHVLPWKVQVKSLASKEWKVKHTTSVSFLYPVVNILPFHYGCLKILIDVPQPLKLDFCGWCSPAFLHSKAGSARAGHGGPCPVGFCISARIRDSIASLVPYSPVFNSSLQWNNFLRLSGISVFQFVPMTLSFHWEPLRRVWLGFVYSSYLQVFVHIDNKVSTGTCLLQAEQSQLSQPLLTSQMLQSLHKLCSLLLDSFPYVHGLLILGTLGLDAEL